MGGNVLLEAIAKCKASVENPRRSLEMSMRQLARDCSFLETDTGTAFASLAISIAERSARELQSIRRLLETTTSRADYAAARGIQPSNSALSIDDLTEAQLVDAGVDCDHPVIRIADADLAAAIEQQRILILLATEWKSRCQRAEAELRRLQD